MADETSTTTTGEQTTAPAATTEAPKAPTAEEFAKVTKALADANAEAAKYRTERKSAEQKAREADEAKAAAEKSKAAEEGRWQDVVKAEKAEAEALRVKLKELDGKASKADKLEAIVTAEVASLEAVVGEERAKSLAHLTPEDRLPILKQFATLVAPGKAPGPKVAAGNVAGTTTAIDIANMTPEQRNAHFAGKSSAEIRDALGIKPSRGLFGR